MKDGEEDDQPTYVVEDSQDTLSKDEYEALVKGNEDEGQAGCDLPNPASTAKYDDTSVESSEVKDASPDHPVPVTQQTAAIGISNKRRLAKVIADENEEVAEPKKRGFAQQEAKPKAKKGKKVKLSFDDDEGDVP